MKNVNAEPFDFQALGLQTVTLGHYLRQSRIRCALSKAALAQRSGLPAKGIDDFEANRAVPSYSDIRVLAQHLGIEEQELLLKVGCISQKG